MFQYVPPPLCNKKPKFFWSRSFPSANITIEKNPHYDGRCLEPWRLDLTFIMICCCDDDYTSRKFNIRRAKILSWSHFQFKCPHVGVLRRGVHQKSLNSLVKVPQPTLKANWYSIHFWVCVLFLFVLCDASSVLLPLKWHWMTERVRRCSFQATTIHRTIIRRLAMQFMIDFKRTEMSNLIWSAPIYLIF